jgi:hypothetical protein
VAGRPTGGPWSRRVPSEDERQTFLDPTNPQTEMSDALLDLFEGMVAKDEVYRLRRHYQMGKQLWRIPCTYSTRSGPKTTSTRFLTRVSSSRTCSPWRSEVRSQRSLSMR